MTKRKVYLIVQAVLCVLLVVLLCAAAVAIYAEGSARKAENPLESVYTPQNVSEWLAWLLPLLLFGIVLALFGVAHGIRDERADRPASASCPMRNIPVPSMPGRNAVRIVLFAAAAVLILLGVLNGSLQDILYKAINICSECIGLG